jgi:hypothetical protein
VSGSSTCSQRGKCLGSAPILHVKFTFPDPDGRDRAGLLVLAPRNNGGYDIHFGGTGTSEDSGKKFGSLAISRSTVGGSCEIVNRP